MKKWFLKLSPIAQGLVVLFILILIWYIFNHAKAFFASIGNAATISGEAAGYEAQGQKRSYTSSQYKQFADKLFSSMDGPGTDEEAIFSVFNQLNNDLDLLEVEKAFGVRKTSYNPFSTPSDLGDWLRSDLSTSDIDTVNNILAQKNILKSY